MGNQALNPCITAIDDEMRATQNAEASKNATGSPKHRLLNRIIGIAASNLAGGGGSSGAGGADGLFKSGQGNLGNLIVKQVQEKVMDIIKDQVLNPSSGGIPGFSPGNNMFIKLNQYLKPADNNASGTKQIFNVSILFDFSRLKSFNAFHLIQMSSRREWRDSDYNDFSY